MVIAAEQITDVDSTAADMLLDLDDELKRQGIALAFEELKGPVKDQLQWYGIYDGIGGSASIER